MNIYIKMLLPFVALLFALESMGQMILTPDTINRKDDNNKKYGYWVEYVNEKLMKVSKKKAYFLRYIYYVKGQRVTAPNFYNPAYKRIEIDGSKVVKDSIVVMDGTYRVYDKNDLLLKEEKYKNGKPLLFKSFYKSGQISEYEDYTKKYNGQEGTCFVIFYSEAGEVQEQLYIGVKDGRLKVIKVDDFDM